MLSLALTAKMLLLIWSMLGTPCRSQKNVPSPAPTTYHPSFLLAYINLAFDIDGLQKKDISEALESCMRDTLSKVLTISISSIEPFDKTNIIKPIIQGSNQIPAVNIHVPLYISLFTTDQFSGQQMKSEKDVVNYMYKLFTQSANNTKHGFMNTTMKAFVAMMYEKPRPQSITTPDLYLIGNITQKLITPMIDIKSIITSNGHPTAQPTPVKLPIDDYKPPEHVMTIVLYSGIGVISVALLAFGAKYLRRFYLQMKNNRIVNERKRNSLIRRRSTLRNGAAANTGAVAPRPDNLAQVVPLTPTSGPSKVKFTAVSAGVDIEKDARWISANAQTPL